MNELKLTITGMSCHHCQRAVEQAVRGVAGVRSAAVDLNAGTLTVRGEALDRAAIAAAVEELGYRVEG